MITDEERHIVREAARLSGQTFAKDCQWNLASKPTGKTRVGVQRRFTV
jgi:hypothetical protein